MIDIEYWKSYFRVMPQPKFQLLVSLVATSLGIGLVLFNPFYYIVLASVSIVIQIATYLYRNKDNG